MQMRHKIDIYGKVESTNSLGEKTYNYEIIKSPMAEIIPQTGKMQKSQANTILTSVTHKIIIWYISELFDQTTGKPKSDMYIMLGSRRFDIKYILDPYELHQKLEIFAEEVIT